MGKEYTVGWNKDHTIYTYTIQEEDGEWLIGNDPDYFRKRGHPDDYPGLMRPDDPRRLMLKFWRALREAKSQRYVGEGHPAILPAHDGRNELVDVLTGFFFHQSRGIANSLGRFSERGSILHAADEDRIWSLGDAIPNIKRTDAGKVSDAAEGVTLCMDPRYPLDQYGIGRGYVYQSSADIHATPEFPNPGYDARTAGCQHELLLCFAGEFYFPEKKPIVRLVPGNCAFIQLAHVRPCRQRAHCAYAESCAVLDF